MPGRPAKDLVDLVERPLRHSARGQEKSPAGPTRR